jgi:hypothetical protein
VDDPAQRHHAGRATTVDQPPLDWAGHARRDRQRADDRAGQRQRAGVRMDDEDDPNGGGALADLGYQSCERLPADRGRGEQLSV